MAFAQNVTYKTRSVPSLYCEICKQFLIGNGSNVTPYKCACGMYLFSADDGEYVLNIAQQEKTHP